MLRLAVGVSTVVVVVAVVTVVFLRHTHHPLGGFINVG